MILGIDPGERRIGVAIADLETRFARPLEVIDTASTEPIVRVVELATEHGVDLIVVGRPVGLTGRAGPAVDAQQQLVRRIRDAVPVEVVEYDERLTTVIAERGLRAAGARTDDRRRLRDAIAAQVMLQGYLDSMR